MKSHADAEPAAPKTASSTRAVWAQVSVFAALGMLEAFSMGLVMPMMPIVTTEYFARPYAHGQPIDCGRNPRSDACIAGSKDANWWSSWISSIGSLCFVAISSTLGTASDAYGRKPFIVASQFLRVGFPFTVMYFVEYGGTILPYFFLRFLNSVFETMGVSSAAIADVVSAQDRASAFGFLMAFGMIGFFMGAGSAGFFTRHEVIRISCVLYIGRTLFATFIFPETLPPEKRVLSHSKCRHVFRNPIKGMSILLRSKLFVRLTIMITLTTFISSGISHIRMFYLNTTIGFDEYDTSRLMLTFGTGSIVAQLLFLRPLMRCGMEKGVIIVALVGRIVESAGYVVSAYIPEKWVIYATVVPSSIGDLSFAAISSLKSVNCSEKEQGRLQGAIYGVRGIFEAVGPVAFAFIYDVMRKDVKWTQVLPFAIAIGVYTCGTVVAMLLPTSRTNSQLPIPFSPSSSVASSPTAATSATGTYSYEYDGSEEYDDEDRNGHDDDENAYLAEPLLGQHSSPGHGVYDV